MKGIMREPDQLSVSQQVSCPGLHNQIHITQYSCFYTKFQAQCPYVWLMELN